MSQPAYPPSGGGWYPAPGGWAPPPPPPPRRRRAVVVWTVAGIVLAAVVLVLVTLAGLRVGGEVGGYSGGAATPSTTAPVNPSGLHEGTPGLDPYAERCHDGDMEACDELAWLSDVMSDYEQYGMTCGGRVKAAAVLSCTQLD